MCVCVCDIVVMLPCPACVAESKQAVVAVGSPLNPRSNRVELTRRDLPPPPHLSLLVMRLNLRPSSSGLEQSFLRQPFSSHALHGPHEACLTSSVSLQRLYLYRIRICICICSAIRSSLNHIRLLPPVSPSNSCVVPRSCCSLTSHLLASPPLHSLFCSDGQNLRYAPHLLPACIPTRLAGWLAGWLAGCLPACIYVSCYVAFTWC